MVGSTRGGAEYGSLSLEGIKDQSSGTIVETLQGGFDDKGTSLLPRML